MPFRRRNDPPQAVTGQTADAGPEVAAPFPIAATSAAPKGRRSPSYGLQQFHLHGQLSDPLHGAIASSA